MRLLAPSVLAAILAIAAPAHADERRVGHKAPGADDDLTMPRWSIEGGVWLVSDYRNAGISSTKGEPAIQAALTVTHQSGLFARAWSSTIASTDGGTVELNLSAGYGWQWGAVEPSVGATLYVFPGVDRSTYVEVFQEVAIPIADATLTLGAAWTPAQDNVDADSLYLGATAEIPVARTGITIDASIGRENGAFGDRKIDWWLGGRYRRGALELGVAYADSHRAFAAHSGPTLLASLGIVF